MKHWPGGRLIRVVSGSAGAAVTGQSKTKVRAEGGCCRGAGQVILSVVEAEAGVDGVGEIQGDASEGAGEVGRDGNRVTGVGDAHPSLHPPGVRQGVRLGRLQGEASDRRRPGAAPAANRG